MQEQQAEILSQKYNIAAMILFCSSRFICTFLLKFVKPGFLLMALAVGGFCLNLGAIFVQGILGLYCLVGISACMSLMFPTIYGKRYTVQYDAGVLAHYDISVFEQWLATL